MRKTAKVTLSFLFLCFVVYSHIAVHEYGHVAVTLLCGGKVGSAGLWPGLQIYPRLDFFWWEDEDRDGRGGWCAMDLPEGKSWQMGLCLLMGSGTTTILGHLALLATLIFRPTRWKWIAMAMVVVVYTGDLIAYAILPKLGLRHAVFVGGPSAEPVHGAWAMGVPEWAFYVLLAIDAFLVYGLLLYSALRLRRNVPNARKKYQDVSALG